MRKFTLAAMTMLSHFLLLAQFRVVGYLPVGAGLAQSLRKVQFDKLTHLNIAFVNPDSSGQFAAVDGLDAVIEKAHGAGVKVLMSIGGGDPPAYYGRLLNDNNRALFIASLLHFAAIHQLDGVDVDLEGKAIDIHYDLFLTALKDSLRIQHKLLTIAMATVYSASVTDHALAQPDFINIMSYDKTGPWKPDKPGEHAPYTMAVDDIAYWSKIRGVPKERLSLGLPFYGYHFGIDPAGDFSYADIIANHPEAAAADTLRLPDGSVLYYNCSATIRKKVILALAHTGGIMIWQLLQDAEGDASLLKLIGETVHQ